MFAIAKKMCANEYLRLSCFSSLWSRILYIFFGTYNNRRLQHSHTYYSCYCLWALKRVLTIIWSVICIVICVFELCKSQWFRSKSHEFENVRRKFWVTLLRHQKFAIIIINEFWCGIQVDKCRLHCKLKKIKFLFWFTARKWNIHEIWSEFANAKVSTV